MLPLILVYTGLFYIVVELYAILQNPGLLVVGLFKVLDLVPSHAQFFADSLMNQLKVEVATRWR